MNRSISVKLIVVNAMIASVYAALTLAISPIAYSEIQFRLSEIMVFLAFYNKKYIPGLIIGCIIANLFSPMGTTRCNFWNDQYNYCLHYYVCN